MEICTHTVPRIFANDGEAALLAVARNSEAYIAESAACDSLFDAFIEALSGHVAQPLRLGGNVPAGESGSVVAGIAVYRSAEVNADYIAAFDNTSVAGYSVNDLIVYGNACRSGEPVVIKERRRGPCFRIYSCAILSI